MRVLSKEVACGVTIQGPLAFYKGFLPNFARLGSWNVIMFLTLEQVSFFCANNWTFYMLLCKFFLY